ncbi:MAG: phage virion morphogenesis protein [Sulfurimicrobium sp.]|nr:phage virion morphogenesis protein [Sulfurimicrobium sp.]
MTTPITIEVNSQSVMDALNQLLRHGQDMRPVMDAIGQRMEERVSARFETKTDPNGQAWAPWKPSTRKSYPRLGNGTLLDRYGDMLGSLNHHANATSVTVGFGKPYALFHEYGTSKMKRRGLLMSDPDTGTLGAEDEANILSLIRGYFAQAI